MTTPSRVSLPAACCTSKVHVVDGNGKLSDFTPSSSAFTHSTKVGICSSDAATLAATPRSEQKKNFDLGVARAAGYANWVPAPSRIGGLFPLTRAKTPYLPTYPQAAQRSEKR